MNQWATQNSLIGNATFIPEYKTGGYIEQPYTREFTSDELTEAVEIINEGSERGMNTWYIRCSSTSPSCDLLMQVILSHGSKVIMEPNDVNGEEAIIAKFGEEAFGAILCFDDQEKKTQVQCEARFADLKQRFPDLLVYSTGEAYTSTALAKRKQAHIMAQQNYQSGRTPLIKRICDHYALSKQEGIPLLANAQSFIGYEGIFPIPSEMSAYAVLSTPWCCGNIWYTFFDGTYSIRRKSENWSAILDITEQIRSNESVILNEDHSVTYSDNEMLCEWSSGLKAEVRLQNIPQVVGRFL